MQFDGHHHAVLQESGAVADEISLKFQLLVGFGVHENQHVFLGEEILEVFLLQTDALDLVFGAETLVELAAIEQVFHFNLCEGTAFAWLDVLDFDNRPKRVLVLKHVTGLYFVSVDFHGTTDCLICLDLRVC
ncbi:hypothetical protein ROS1_01610 [Roseibium sp. ROS1]